MLRCFFLLFIIISQAAAPAQGAENKPSISAEAFGQLPGFGQIELSPDGSRVASLQNFKGEMVLVTQSFKAGERKKISLTAYQGAEINWFQWVNNSRLIISVGYDEVNGFTRFRVSRMMAMNWDKSDVKQLLMHDQGSQYHDRVVSMLPEDPDHILMAIDRSKANHPDVYKINVYEGSMKRHLKNRSSVRNWMADGAGVVRLGLGKYKNRNRLIFRNGAGEKWRNLAKYDVIEDKVPFSVEGFSDLAHVIYVSKLNEDGRRAFYRYDTEKAEFLDKVADHDKVDISGLIINKKGEITGYHYLDERRITVYKGKFYQGLQKMLKRNFPDHQVWILSKSRDKKVFIFKVTGPDLPGDLYLLNLHTGDLVQFASTRPSVDETSLSGMEIITYKARDGLDIPGYVSLPKSVDLETARKLPTVIMPHGGPFARDGFGYDYWVQFLTTRGYAVLQMNYRGSTGYGVAFEEKGYHEWGRKMLEDINDGARWMISQGYADPDRMCIMGGSYGGYAALQAVVKDQSLYKCSIAFAPVTDVSMMLRDDRDFLDYKRNEYYVRNDDLSTKAISPLNHLDKLSLPILLIHGTDDRSVYYKHGQKFARKMKKRRKDFKFVTLKDGDHHLSLQDHRVKFLQEVEKFLGKYL